MRGEGRALGVRPDPGPARARTAARPPGTATAGPAPTAPRARSRPDRRDPQARPGEGDPAVGVAPRVVGGDDRGGLGVEHGRAHVGAVAAQQVDDELHRASRVDDVVDDEQPPAPDRLRVEQRGEQHRVGKGLRDAGVELHVDGVGELHIERIGERPAGDHAAAGHRDDDLRLETRVHDGLGQLPRRRAEALPGEDLLLIGRSVIRHGGILARRLPPPHSGGEPAID